MPRGEMSGTRDVRSRRTPCGLGSGVRRGLLSAGVVGLALANLATPQTSTSAAGEQPWSLTGVNLQGALDGPTEIDSLKLLHGDLQVRALHGRWLPGGQLLELIGDVEIRDSLRVINGERGFYQRERQLLDLEQEVRGSGPEGRIFSDHLQYDRGALLLTLTGFVRLHEETRSLRCDWLRYDLADSSATAGDVIDLRDETDSLEVHGRSLFYDRRAGVMTVTGSAAERPRLLRSTGNAGLILTIVADTLRLHVRERGGEAFGKVTLEYGETRGSCARAWFAGARDQLFLTGAPQIWDREGNMAGDSMAVELHDRRAERLRVWHGAHSEYAPLARPGERHLVVGDTLTAYLAEGAVRNVVVSGGAEALYLPGEVDRRNGVGLNWTGGKRIRLVFAKGGVDRVQFEGEAHGRYLLPRPAGGDSLAAAPTPAPAETVAVLGGYRQEVLAGIRARAAQGSLELPDSLLRELPFDPAETVQYSGDAIDFGVESERMAITGASHVAYKGMELNAKEIVFHSSRNLVVASGEPVLRDRDTEVQGEEMTYRVDRRQGLVFQGRSELGTGHYRGERVKRTAPKVFFVQNGEFTTCDADSAHFHFLAPRMKIIPGERVIARPVVLFLGQIPLLAIPYAVFPIRRGRQSGILIPEVEFGFDTSRGRFLRNVGYYYAPNDYLDGLLWLDYYEKDPRVTLNARGRYRLRYLLDGVVEGSFTRQKNYLGGRRDRWLFRLDHDQTLGERFSLKVSGHFQSDKDYGGDRDFGASVDDRLNRVLRSQLSLSKSGSLASLSLVADRTEYLDDCSGGASRVQQTIPSLNLSINSFPIGVRADDRGRGGHLPFLASTYARGDLRLRGVYSRDCTGESETNQAAGLGLSLSDKRRLLGAINLTPSASLSAAWVHADPDGHKDLTGMVWQAGFSAGTTLYGTFLPRLAAWQGLRHVVELSANYGYRPEIRHLKGFPTVGGIGLSSSKSSAVSLSATQRFHVKWGAGEKVSKRENLLVWSTSTRYDFLEKERARDSNRKAQPWGDISHSWRLQPGNLLQTELSLRHDPERWHRSYDLSLRTTLHYSRGGGAAGGESAPDEYTGNGSFGDPAGGGAAEPGGETTPGATTGPMQFSLTHVLTRSREGASVQQRSSVNLACGFSFTPGWRLQYSIYYDLTESEVSSQGYTLYRDLHCWHAVLERRTSGGRSSYYFRISVKDLPDIKYERRQ